MNTEREELEDAIARAAYNYNPDRGRDGNDVPFDQADTSYEKSEAKVVAEALIAAGYRKARTIATQEEVNDLPAGAIVLDAYAATCTKLNAGVTTFNWRRVTTAVRNGVHSRQPYLPAEVIYIPEECAR